MAASDQTPPGRRSRHRQEAAAGPILERRTDDLYLTLVENSVVGLGLYIPGEPLVFCNQRLADITGYEIEEVISPDFDVMELFKEEDRAVMGDNIRRRMAGEHIPPYELALVRKDKKLQVVEVNNVPVMYGDKRAIQVQLIDITDRKQTEVMLKKQATELQAVNETLEEKSRLLSALQAIGDMAAASLNLDQVLDSLAQQILKAGIFRSLMVALVDEATNSVEVVRSFISQFDDGRFVPGAVVKTSGDVIGLRYDLNDANITALTARTGELQVLDGWDKRFDAKVDYDKELDNKVSYFIPVKKDDRVLAVMATASPPEQKEEILHRIDAMRPLLGQVAISIDHARLFKEAQDHAREWVRMERVRAIGEMAEGIAHNFNNMLTAILGHAELSKLHNLDPIVEGEIDLVISATLRANELVKRLRGSARREDLSHLYPVTLNEIVEQAVEGTRPMWKDRSEAGGIAISVDMQLDEVPAIGGTESETFDMLTNLLLNAVDAMPEGGGITIVTRPTDDGVRLIIGDTGIGLDEETKRRIFEPLFTTKSSVGSGLGLTTVQDTLNRWGGSIRVRSSPGQGAEFEIFLPRWKESTITEDRPEPPGEIDRSTRARVLVVDDEPAVCQIISSFLSRDHEVATFLDPREAQAQFEPGCWDVAVIDLGMPGVPGDELARSLKQIDPHLVTVLSTGWGITADDPRLREFDWRLEKPFRKAEVEDVIFQALEGR